MGKSRVVAVAAALVLMSAAPAIAEVGDVVSLDFESSSALDAPVTTSLSAGSADVTARVVTRDAGAALATPGLNGTALRLPTYSSGTTEPRAVLRITNASSIDNLSPAASDFSFGATTRLDAESQGTLKLDNGNNVVQRGLSSDPAQYKLDLDDRFPGCTVKGDQGKVSVRIREAVSADDWYRMVCGRVGSTVTLTVSRYHPDGTVTQRTKSVTGPIGSVTMATSTVPMSVGGKLNAKGAIVAATTDQFNGVVDDAFLRIEEPAAPVE